MIQQAYEAGVSQGAGTIDNPDDSLIEEWIRLVAEKDGKIKMELISCPEVGPQYMDLYAEGGRLLAMLIDVAENGEPDVRTLTVETQPAALESVFGEPYPAKAITRDIKLVCAVLKEFAHTGNVSRDLMD